MGIGVKNINIAEDFSPAPAGRYLTDGDFTGELFRTKHLRPAIEKGYKVIINVAGLIGAGSSFMEEAFGGLIRTDNCTLEQLRQKLAIVPEDDDYAMEIWEYIEKEARIKKQ